MSAWWLLLAVPVVAIAFGMFIKAGDEIEMTDDWTPPQGIARPVSRIYDQETER